MKLRGFIPISFVGYLANHEHDIASGVNDFGDLKEIFEELFGREPEEIAFEVKEAN